MKRYLVLSAILALTVGATLGVHSQAFASYTDHDFMVSSFFDIEYVLAGNPGSWSGAASGTARGRVHEKALGVSYFDTEMLQLNLAGPGPFGTLLVRESPSKASTGRTDRLIGDPDFDLLSFFDVFTEISIDGGQTWALCNNEVMGAHFASAPSHSFFDIDYGLGVNVPHSGGHVTVLKAGSTMHMTEVVPEPSSMAALLTGVVGLAGFGIRRRKTI